MNLVNGCVTTINKTNDSGGLVIAQETIRNINYKLKTGNLLIYIRGIKTDN